MKKKKILTGAAIGASMAGLLFGGCKAVPQDLYGPPPEALYGPPADENTETYPGEETEKTQTDAAAETEPSTAMALYGPPPAEG